MQGDCQMSYSTGKSTGKQYIITLYAGALSEFTERKRIKTRQTRRRNPDCLNIRDMLFGRPNWGESNCTLVASCPAWKQLMSQSDDSEPIDLVVIDGGNCRRPPVTSPTLLVVSPSEPVQTHVLQGMRSTCVNICVPTFVMWWGKVNPTYLSCIHRDSSLLSDR